VHSPAQLAKLCPWRRSDEPSALSDHAVILGRVDPAFAGSRAIAGTRSNARRSWQTVARAQGIAIPDGCEEFVAEASAGVGTEELCVLAVGIDECVVRPLSSVRHESRKRFVRYGDVVVAVSFVCEPAVVRWAMESDEVALEHESLPFVSNENDVDSCNAIDERRLAVRSAGCAEVRRETTSETDRLPDVEQQAVAVIHQIASGGIRIESGIEREGWVVGGGGGRSCGRHTRHGASTVPAVLAGSKHSSSPRRRSPWVAIGGPLRCYTAYEVIGMLEIGDLAPEFDRISDVGERVRLSDFRGKRVIVYFYPKANTPGCTKQACAIQDLGPQIDDANVTVIGISPDPPEKLATFRAKYGLTFHLLSDPDHEAAKAYGAWGEKSMYGKKYMGIVRSHAAIDEEGRIVAFKNKVKPLETAALWEIWKHQ